MDKKKILTLFLLVIPQLVSGEEILFPVSYIDVRVVQTGKIYVGDAEYVKVNVTVPLNSEIEYVSNTYTIFKDKNSKIVEISADVDNKYFNYTIVSRVRNSEKIIKSINENITIKDFLEESKNIQSNEKRIKEIAKKIVGVSKTKFEMVVKLAKWVNENVKYDIKYSDKNYDALWVLENMRGVCAEYTTLFIALARSLGIPARYVHAYAYGSNGWESHAYAEVWIGKWIPVDVLWMQIGWVDATHIDFGKYESNVVKNTVQVIGRNVKNVEWIEENVDITILNYTEKKIEEKVKIYKNFDVMFPNDSGIIILEYLGDTYELLNLFLTPCEGPYDVVYIENKSLFLWRDKKIDYWKIYINENLPKNYIFECPLSLNTRYKKIANITLIVKTNKKGGKNIKCSMVSNTLKVGEKQEIFVEGEDFVGIIDGNIWKEVNTNNYIFKYKPVLGKHEVLCYSKSSIDNLEYEVISDNISVLFDVPHFVEYGKDFNVSAYIKFPQELIVSIDIFLNGKFLKTENTVTNTVKVFSIPINRIGKNEIVFNVQIGKYLIKKRFFVISYNVPELKIKGKIIYNKHILIVNTDGTIFNVTIYYNNQTIFLDKLDGEKRFEVENTKGFHIKIFFQDIGHKKHVIEKYVLFEQSIVEEIISYISNLISILSNALNIILT